MTHCCFCQGLISFFQSLAHCFVRDAFAQFEFHELVGKQPQRPANAPFRGLRAAQRDESRLRFAVDFARLGARAAAAFLKGPVHAFLHEAAFDPVYAAHVHMQHVADLLVGLAVVLMLPDVGSEQYEGVEHGVGCSFAAAAQRVQLVSFFLGKVCFVENFRHRSAIMPYFYGFSSMTRH